MKKSLSVLLGSLAVVAGMVGCDDQTKDVRTCVDKNNNVVDDKNCTSQPQTAQGTNPDDAVLRDILIYHWIFGGNYQTRGSSFVYIGGGGYRSSPSVIYVAPSSGEGHGIVSSGSAGAYGRAVGGGYGGVARGGFGGSISGGGE